MTHPALEARARGALKPLAPDTVKVSIHLPADLCSAIARASFFTTLPVDVLIIDILRDAFPSGEG